MSADSVSYRIKNLEKLGIIQSFTCVFNLDALGYSWYTCAFQMKKLDQRNEMKLKEFFKVNSNVLSAVKTMGDWDVFLYLAANDPDDFHKTIKSIKKEFGEIIRNYDVWIAYQEYYFNPFPKVLENLH